MALVGVDAARVLVAEIVMGSSQPRGELTRLTLNGVRDGILGPLLRAVLDLLRAGELYGRTLLEVSIGQLNDVLELDDSGGHRHVPVGLPLGAELSLPLGDDSPEVSDVLEIWRADVGRSAGYLTLRPDRPTRPS
jgi:hypothetical protein